MGDKLSLRAVPDDELLRRLSDLTRQSRRVEADLVAHIGEVDVRRLYAREAASSMFAYCTEVLHLSEAEAWLRILVARATREHPVLLAMLRDGRLHLSAIRRLAPHLTPANRPELLKRAVHKSRRQIEELVAEVAPRPDAPAGIRKLPAPRRPAPSSTGFSTSPQGAVREDDAARASGSGVGAAPPVGLPAAPGAPASPDAGADAASGPIATDDRETLQGSIGGNGPRAILDPPLGPDPVGGMPAVARPRPAQVEPLAPERYRVQFTASAGLRAKLERLQALLRSSVPDGDLATLVELAVTEKIERLEAQPFARTKNPRKSLTETGTTPSSRHIPAPVRRAVHERDEGRCTYVDVRGRRCTAGERLEFHHRRPFGRGGDHSPDNLALTCRTHNALLAELDFGKKRMTRHRRPERSGGRAQEPTAGRVEPPTRLEAGASRSDSNRRRTRSTIDPAPTARGPGP